MKFIKYFGIVLLTSMFIFFITPNNKVHAETYNAMTIYCCISYNDYYKLCQFPFQYNNSYVSITGYNTYWSWNTGDRITCNYKVFQSVGEAYNYFVTVIQSGQNFYWDYTASYATWTTPYDFVLFHNSTYKTYEFLIDPNINGNIFNSYQDYEDSLNPPADPTWYEKLWEDFKVFCQEVGLVAENIFDEFIDFITGDGSHGGGHEFLPQPLPTPTPIPTPIPYETIMTPDGNGGFVIEYKYINPSGTPIITSQPPQQNVNIDVDNNFEYPYYDNPENKNNPYEFKIPWYLKLYSNNTEIVGEDSLTDSFKTVNGLVEDEDVLNAVDEVYNGFAVIPSGWLLIIGAIASLPLFAALIHRFLGG